MKVKLIDDKPLTYQESIEHLIGNVYEVIYYDQEDESVSVMDESFGGEIVLNKSEYIILDV